MNPTTQLSKFELPTIFVIFGITGDLAKKKIIKALYLLHLKSQLPKKFQIYGFSRRDYDDVALRDYLKDIMTKGKYPQPEKYDEFLQSFTYVAGDFDNKESYKKLAKMLGRVDDMWRICSNKLFYLAVPPVYYRHIIDNLHDSGLTIPCSPEEGWTRVILEKPFGTDLQSAKELDARLAELFKEEQIYRVDHFLAKETVRNILAFRFSNSFFTPAWNNQFIKRIDIKLLEQGGVSTRGEFYDKVGTLRDVGQNHMLQLLALFIMDNPKTFTAEGIRQKRAEALASLHVFSEDDVSKYSVRGQYEGYRQEKGVNSQSTTETYFKLKLFSHKHGFENVPIYLESGKGMAQTHTEIKVTFRHQRPCMCPKGKHVRNTLSYCIYPKEKIITSFVFKQPGYDYTVEEKDFEFDYKNIFNQAQFIEDYEQLLMDIIKGDQTLFVSTSEIFSEWEFVEPILNAWKTQSDIKSYVVGDTVSLEVEDDLKPQLKKELALVGLGKMGSNLATNLIEKGWRVVGYNRSKDKTEAAASRGLIPAYSLQELAESVQGPRIVWIMLTAGEAVDEALFGKEGLVNYLQKGDIVVDGGNSFYKDAIRRSQELAKRGITFVDVGFSGGPGGARNGGCLMIGGDKKTYNYLRELYKDIALPGGEVHFEGVGAGHFVKMVHNGIEYGMMQAIAEGMHILKEADFKLDLEKVAEIYNHGSVIESKLTNWLHSAFKIYGTNLEGVLGTVAHTGEGAWTINTAKEMGIKAKVIEDALQFRIDSEKNPDYTGQVLSALRNQFGGHAVKK